MTENRGRASRGALWLVLACAFAGIFALVQPAFQQVRSRPVPRCRVHLKQIGLALHNYHDVYGSLPPAAVYGPDGKPWHSWRVLILPYLEQAALAEEYRLDEPWDGPHNRRLLDSMPEIYRCPEDEDAAPGTTSYVAVVGDGTMWPVRAVTSFDEVSDGLSRTLMVVEMSDSGVPWTKPLDLRLGAMTLQVDTNQPGIRSRHENGASALFGDGAVRYLSAEIAAETVNSLLLKDDGRPEEAP